MKAGNLCVSITKHHASLSPAYLYASWCRP